MLFGHKQHKLQIDLGELLGEREHLTEFLKSTLKVNVNMKEDRLELDSDKVQPPELQRVLTKFIYKRNLNNAYWISVDGSIAKVNRFKGAKKPDKEKKKSSGHQTITQSWGL